MKLPVVMPSNLNSMTKRLSARFPGRLALLFGMGGWADPRGLPFALDNGRFPVWSKGLEWDEGGFWALIERAKAPLSPLWLAVPDVVTDAGATVAEWKRWHPTLHRLGWPLALVVQDGMTPTAVKDVRPRPDVIFVGGSTAWKWRTVRQWCLNFPRVHVGRVNTYGLLWAAHRAGAESSDGTGWWHKVQKAQLIRYLERSQAGVGQTNYKGFFW